MYRKAILLSLVSLGLASIALVVVGPGVSSLTRALVAGTAAGIGAVVAMKLQGNPKSPPSK